MAQTFEQILQSINNSEIRIALENLFAIVGVGTGDSVEGGSGPITADVTGDLTGNVTGNVTGTLVGPATKQVVTTAPQNALNALGMEPNQPTVKLISEQLLLPTPRLRLLQP